MFINWHILCTINGHDKMFTVHSASGPYNTTPFAFAKFYISTNCAMSLLCVQDLFQLGKRFTGAVVASMSR